MEERSLKERRKHFKGKLHLLSKFVQKGNNVKWKNQELWYQTWGFEFTSNMPPGLEKLSSLKEID